MMPLVEHPGKWEPGAGVCLAFRGLSNHSRNGGKWSEIAKYGNTRTSGAYKCPNGLVKYLLSLGSLYLVHSLDGHTANV